MISELVRAERWPLQSETSSSQPATKGGRLNNTGVTVERLSISHKDQGGSGHCQAAAAQVQDAPKGSAQRLRRLSHRGHHAGPIQWHTLAAPHIPVPAALINSAASPAQPLQYPSSQPQEREDSPTAASQGCRVQDSEKVISAPAQGVQNLCPPHPLSQSCLSEPHGCHRAYPTLGCTHTALPAPRTCPPLHPIPQVLTQLGKTTGWADVPGG